MTKFLQQRSYLFIASLVFWATAAFAQVPVNDECINALDINTLAPSGAYYNYCSLPSEFTSVNATAGVYTAVPAFVQPLCFGGATGRDVWFKFTTDNTNLDLTLTIRGGTLGSGLLHQPQIALYREGTFGCPADGNDLDLECVRSAAGASSLAKDFLGLDPATVYYIRVNDYSASATPNAGAFQLCLKTYIPRTILDGNNPPTVNACTGSLVDDGNYGNYSNSTNETVTITAPSSGCMLFVLDSLDIRGNATFTVFNGLTTASPVLAALTAASNSNNPRQYIATAGSVTIRFVANATGVVGAGFVGHWECAPNCAALQPCSAIIYDPQGPTGNYLPNQTVTNTYCPNAPGRRMEIGFTAIDVPAGDNFIVYDGNSAAAPVIVTLDNNNFGGVAGGIYTVNASIANMSGCLTVVFNADASTQGTGFVGQLKCNKPCQRIDPMFNIGAISPPYPTVAGDSAINICNGTAITVSASANYPENNTLYPQSDASSLYYFNWGDGSAPTVVQGITGAHTATHTYTTNGIRFITIKVADVDSLCAVTDTFSIRVRSIGKPRYRVTAPPPICLGQSTNLVAVPLFNGAVGPIGYVVDTLTNTPPINSAGSFCIPDNTTQTFTSTVTAQGLNNFTLSSTCHIKAVYMNLQHTWLGDLIITLKCPPSPGNPAGTTITLLNGNTGPASSSTYLGLAHDIASTTCQPVQEAAQGWWYGFNGLNTTSVSTIVSSSNPPLPFSYNTNPTGVPNIVPYTMNYFNFPITSATVLNAGIISGIINPYTPSTIQEYIAPGFYSTQQPMSVLNGCPMNGAWTLEIDDDQGADDGFIYEWGIIFDDCAYPNLETYIPQIQQAGFACAPTITTPANCAPTGNIINNTNTVTVTPTTVGQNPYTFSIRLADFPPCNFDTVVNVTVLALPNTPTLPDQSACLGQPVNLNMGPVCTNVTPFTVSGGSNITIPTIVGNANPFPSALNVTLTGSCNYVVESVTVNGILHAWPNDIDMWLVSPTGQAVVLMSDCGSSVDFLAGTNLTYKMGAPLMTGVTPTTGTYAPTNIDVTTDAGVPAGATTNLSTLTGTPAQMSGNWGLYIRDDFSGNGGSVQNWSITFSTPPPPYATSWSTGSTTSAITVTCGTAGTSTYTVTATAANGCTTTQDAIVTCGTLAAPVMSCDTTVAGQITYSWPAIVATPAVTGYNASANIAPATGTPLTSIGNVLSYTVTGLGQNQTVSFQNQAVGACTSLVDTLICRSQASCGVTGTPTDASCGGNNGSITTAPTGTAPFTYVWTTTTATPATGANPTGLASGTYTVVVTDVNNCTSTTTITVGDTTPLPAPVVSCSNQALTSIDIAWAAVAGATGYEVNVVGAGWTNIGNVLTYNNSGMVTGACVTIDVRATGGLCTNLSGSQTCCASPCSMTAMLTPTASTCNNSTGTLSAMAMNTFTAPLTYAWSNAILSGANPTGIAAGTYTVTITDALSCTATASAIVAPSTGINAVFANTVQPSCGLNNGALNVNPSNGLAPYTYAWSPSTLSGANPTALAPNTYTVTVTDANNCTVTASTVLNTSPALTVSLTAVQQPTCGQNNAGVTATASGGNGVYTYIWTGGQTTALIGNQANGSTHTVTVTCAAIPGCTATASITFNSNNPLAAVVTPTNVTCNGLVNGRANVNVLNGNGGYTFLWSANAANQTTNPATGLAGTATGTVYTVTITDAQACSITRTVTITQPNVLAVTVNPISIVQPACFGGSNGGATATSTGGSPFYTYAWDMGTVGAAPNSVVGLNAGTHTVTVTDLNGCTSSTTFVVGQPTQIMTTAVATTNAACNGGTNGVLTAVANSATAPYVYALSNGNITGATTGVFTGLAAGTYTVTATDANGCATTASAIITQPAPIVLSLTSTLTSCFGGTDGTATVMAAGGNNVFTYAWDVTPNTAATATGLNAGTHTVTVTDGNGCATSTTVVVGSPTAVTATIAPNPINPTCTTGGSAMATGAGGTPNYTYAWTGGSTAQMPTNLTAGLQTVTVTDSKGCTATANVTLSNPSNFTASITPQQPSCGLNNGSVSALPAGNYTYMWNGGIPTQTRVNIGAGFYVVTVTDIATQCTATASQTLTASTAPSAAITVTQPTCITPAELCTTVANGLPTYTYLWDNSATTACISPTATGSYTVTVTDAAGCTATRSASITMPAPFAATIASTNAACNGQTGTINTAITASSGAGVSYVWTGGLPAQANHTGVAAGTYTVVMTDLGTQCVQTLTATVTEPNVLGSWANSGVVSCATGNNSNGQINFPAYGGTTPYSFAIPGQTNSTGIFTGLPSGNYTCTITDANGCIANATTYVGSPGAVIAYATPGSVSCFGGSNGQISVNAQSGTAPYTYTLGAVSNATGVFGGLSSGNYTVSVTDANGCAGAVATTWVGSPGPVAAYATPGAVTCFGVSNGQISVNAQSGTAPYTYTLGAVSNATGVFAGLPSGNYTVNITDVNGCPGTASTYVGSPGAVIAYATPGAVTCFGGSNGQISVNAQSGAGGTYTYSLTGYPNNTTGVFAGLPSGNYTVNITDVNGCPGAASTYVGSPGPVAAYATPGVVTCFGNSTGQISVTAQSGAGAPYTYTLGAASNQTGLFTGLAEGIYTVSVSDANGCTGATASTWVGSPGPVIAYATPGTVSCFVGNNSDGQITVSAQSGAGAPYTFSLTGYPNNQTGVFAGLPSGSYTVSVTDVNGCAGATTSTWVGSPGALEAYATNGSLDCFGATNGQISVSAASGTSPYTFAINATTSNSTGLFTGLGSADYAVTVTDAKGCTTISSTWVGQPGPIAAYATPGTVSCLVGNNSDGAISFSAASGTAPYTYTFNGSTGTANTFTGLTTGIYTVTITDSKACSTTASTYVGAPGPYIVDITPSATTITVGAEGTLTATAGTSYVWTPQGGNTQQITIKPLVETTYTVTVTSTQNCIATASITIQVRQTGITMPNFFTPNGDGRNDTFFAYTQDPTIQFTTFKIYNRWGDLVHNSTSPWDGNYNGSEQPMETYVYVIQYTLNGVTETKNGSFMLIR
jgi:large repetitive protein